MKASSLGASIAKAYIYIMVASGWQYTVDAIRTFTTVTQSLTQVQLDELTHGQWHSPASHCGTL
jgi:hypothetical protein